MGRSKPSRAGTRAAPVPAPHPPAASRAPEGVRLGPLDGETEDARRLFSYAGAGMPAASPGEFGWGAWIGEGSEGRRLIGAVLLESTGATGFVHGPVVVVDPGLPQEVEPVEIAAHLLAALVPHATASGIDTLFARPQGLDRVWVRFGFIPVPEADLPAAFRRRPGTGLFAWRGGTALWSSRRRAKDGAAEPRP